MTWLEPLQAALDGAEEPIVFFLRDDDAGWNDERLFSLLDLCGEYGLPLDLAVIPAALRASSAAALIDRAEHGAGVLGMHQHGFAHVNHEPSGRKCEFGPARSADAQRRDIAAGRRLLRRLLGPWLDPIFTPPWNRCARVTGECLLDLGFVAISRESRASPLGIPGLCELPSTVDWFAHHRGVFGRLRGLYAVIERATPSHLHGDAGIFGADAGGIGRCRP